ncbi:MAG: dTDP-glucose 4,6-dehydratase [Candidatus Dependentiae bacterium]
MIYLSSKKISILFSWIILFSYFIEAKNVFVTGGAGFIGSNFINYMFKKYPDYHFTVLDKLTYAGNLNNINEQVRNSNRFTFVKGCITDVELVDQLMSDADFVVHFAAESHVARSIVDDYVFFETDVLGTRSLMAALVKHNKRVERFIHISTSEVFGTAEEFHMTEDHPINPRTPYAAAKAGADRLVYAYWCTYDIPAVIVRPFNNYGPNQHVEKLIPRLIAQAIEGIPLTIHGNGEQKRDWVHTYDIARALDMILHADNFSKIKNQVINLGSGRATSVNEIANVILTYFNLPDDFKNYTKDRPGQVMLHISDTKKALELLGWEPKINLEEGLENVIEWYRHNTQHWTENLKTCRIPIKHEDNVIEHY